MTIDLNCDLGEGARHDAELMPLITSANIACGAHAGDEAVMRRTLELARRDGVAAGAHPGYADRGHFGRRELVLAPGEVSQLVSDQIQRLQEIAGELGMNLTHVKPHGALYNQAARDRSLAGAVVRAIDAVNPRLILFALAGSTLMAAAREYGLVVAAEIFADRRYRPDGSLIPRSDPNACIADPREASAQVLCLIREGRADTVCIHGDGHDPVEFARVLREELHQAGVEVKPYHVWACRPRP